jgi:predicted RNase H-like HicB family nuclease
MRHLSFTGIVYLDSGGYSALCPELDIRAKGSSPFDAIYRLQGAISRYLKIVEENGIPYLRPIPSEQDPRITDPSSVVKVMHLGFLFFRKRNFIYDTAQKNLN